MTMPTPDSTHIRSAIIGMWRMGASVEEICRAVLEPRWEVEWVIADYCRENKIKKIKDG